MIFQLLSDLHLEQSGFELERAPGCEALVLAGDVGDPCSARYRGLVARAAELFEHVVLIAGNHECYGRTVVQAHAAIEGVVAPFPNVHFLNRRAVTLRGVRVAGATLWSKLRGDQTYDVMCFIQDFRRIEGMTAAAYGAEHDADVAFLRGEIRHAFRSPDKPLLVVTHHAPFEGASERPEHVGSPLSSAFETDLVPMIRPPVAAWAWGHTHSSRRLERAGVQLVSNQRGFPGEASGFDPAFTFEVAET